MSRRRAFLDEGFGERRGVVQLDGRPERLIIERDGAPASQRLGARSIGRVRRIERGLQLAFLELPEGTDAAAPAARLVEGQGIEVEVVAEARREKGPGVRIIGPAQGSPRLLAAAPDL